MAENLNAGLAEASPACKGVIVNHLFQIFLKNSNGKIKNRLYFFLKISFFLAVGISAKSVRAEDSRQGFGVNIGLIQPFAFNGWNLALEWRSEKWFAEYSHGWDLKIHKFDQALTSQEKSEKIKLTLPWTTGFGIGYRLTSRMTIAVEFKAHKYEVESPLGQKLDYVTYSIGPGLAYDFTFAGSWFLRPMLRYWPNVGTDLNKEARLDRADGSQYNHKAHDFGLFANLLLGYTF